MLRQMLQDAMLTLHVTGSVTAAILVIAAPIVVNTLRR